MSIFDNPVPGTANAAAAVSTGPVPSLFDTPLVTAAPVSPPVVVPTPPAPIPSLASAPQVQAPPVVSSVAPLTLEQFRLALPDKVKKSVHQELIDQINNTLSQPEMFEAYRDNLLSYTKVMADGRFKIQNYVDAVRYVSFKLMGCTNIEAYTKTFPDKYQRFRIEGVEAKDIASYVTAYNKSKLVNLIFEQTLIPVHVLNMDMYQKALNIQMDLAMNAKSEKVRSDAANSILSQLKPPEVKKVELDIGVKEDGSINALREATMELVRQQRLAMESGVMNAQDAAHQIIEVEAKEVHCEEKT
jgi:hypothetical protein